MELEKTFIELFGLKILEPVTTATDLLVSAVCFYAFLNIHKSTKRGRIFFLFKYYFLSMGIATAYGGIIGHALLYLFSFEWKIPGWIISMFSIALIERATIMHAMPLLKPTIGNFFSVLNILEFIILVCIVLYTLNFFFVETHAFYGLMIVVASFELYVFLKTKDSGSRILLYAVFISAVAATVHLTKFSPHQWFNYLDLSHVLMALAAYAFYRGIMTLRLN